MRALFGRQAVKLIYIRTGSARRSVQIGIDIEIPDAAPGTMVAWYR